MSHRTTWVVKTADEYLRWDLLEHEWTTTTRQKEAEKFFSRTHAKSTVKKHKYLFVGPMRVVRITRSKKL